MVQDRGQAKKKAQNVATELSCFSSWFGGRVRGDDMTISNLIITGSTRRR